MNANEPSTSCCVCCKEIPLDAAFTPEGAEYVEHFCGLECVIRRRQVEAYPNLMSDAMCKLRQDRIEF
ncbi:Transposon Tn21 modulator protein [Salmonella enterica subsp. enterica serovar Typhi]|nr:Transposon Tn21 modulator protein [Salmonella enterica subsp. enterica serovar Typhi]